MLTAKKGKKGRKEEWRMRNGGWKKGFLPFLHPPFLPTKNCAAEAERY
jgi:hypothetical protein